eukprot:NODE_1639_length_1462_cov_25.186837_g1480_i0.p1 GENE.NODE_1639_length_1462_cov_25.186837_g1480_i0~~NODE_1639_length_1462_cov_25.186837_g1480_i0.p1  ORF type:complete len:237 (-),score=53.14 NODE_1639_length_1462_cov_25.186837_g1480_i0:88-798(-)
MAVLSVICLLLLVLYGEVVCLLAFFVVLPSFLVYFCFVPLAPRKVRDLVYWQKRCLLDAAYACWRKLDTNPIAVRTHGGWVLATHYEASKLRESQKRLEEQQAKEAEDLEARRKVRRREEKDEVPIRFANIKPAERPSSSSSAAAAATLRNVSETTAVTEDTATPSHVWTKEQQGSFERALRKFPVGTSSRWEKIEAEVPGKSRKQCIQRFQALVQMKERPEEEKFCVNVDKKKKN